MSPTWAIASCKCAEMTLKSSVSTARSRNEAMLTSALYALDVGAESRELFLNALEAAVEMIDAIDDRFTLRRQARDDQADRSPKIGRHDRRAVELFDAAHDRGLVVDRDVGAHAHEFGHV